MTEEELNEQVRCLSRSNEDLSHFAFMASHELQEPLRAVESFVTLLSKKYGPELPQEAKEWLGETAAGTSRMRRLIRSLLSFSLADSQDLTIEKVNCADALNAALGDLKPIMDAKDVQMLVEPDLPTVEANAVLLSLLFRNLISNSIKYCSERPTIKIRASREKDDYVFEIADNGIGFDMKYADKIFRPFERLHSKADYPGTGLGLALCKRIIERHHGRIWVHSAVNEGSNFSFALPCTHLSPQPRV